MMTRLSEGQCGALVNLGQKKAGESVGWINISDARVLADLGLARRTGGGWVLTAAGEARLALELSSRTDQSTAADILNFANDEGTTDHGRA